MKKFIMYKKEQEIIKEDISEDWCFFCKDGGSLRVCDYKKCPKAYHAECVEEDSSFMHSESKWTCRWHSCFQCKKPSKYRCFCCPTSLCQSCANIVEFACVRGTKGFCHQCLKLVLLGEGNKTADSDGPIDFNNQETYECLFLECWFITKKEEKLTSEDLQTASTFLNNWNKRNTSYTLVSESSESDTKSDSYTKDVRKEEKSKYVKKRSKCEPSGSKSKPDKPSYCPGKKRTSRTVKQAAEMEKVQEVPKSRFAAIVEENIKIAFLMKSLVRQLLDNHQSEAFDSKVIGCFVKIRSDPLDYSQKNRCQLVLIKGVKRILQDGEAKVILQASTGIIHIELEIEKLLDVIFDKEELDDLRKRVESGLIPRPTVVDLELKAKSLHVELTNHAIDKELQSLEYHIDTANLNGWRAELFTHLNRKELLKSPEERKRMIETIPHVIPAPTGFDREPLTLNGRAGDTLEEVPAILNSAIAGENQQPNQAVEEITLKKPPMEVIYIDSEDDDDG